VSHLSLYSSLRLALSGEGSGANSWLDTEGVKFGLGLSGACLGASIVLVKMHPVMLGS
jgi:hypothetical protein